MTDLEEALHQKAVAEARRDAALATAEAVQADIAAAHLQELVRRKAEGTRLEQLGWLAASGVVVGLLLAVPLVGYLDRAGAGEWIPWVRAVFGLGAGWFVVAYRLRRVAREKRQADMRDRMAATNQTPGPATL